LDLSDIVAIKKDELNALKKISSLGAQIEFLKEELEKERQARLYLMWRVTSLEGSPAGESPREPLREDSVENESRERLRL